MPLILAALLLWPSAVISEVRPVASDEEIQWFPALATPQGENWKVTFSGLVTENKNRPAASWLARKLLGFSHEELGSDERAVFRARTERFLADDETGKRMQMEILGKRYDFGKTGRNGRFSRNILLPKNTLHPGPQTVPCVVYANRRAYTNDAPVFAIAGEGISVVSDIDDTIKVSDVRHRDELMRNTFLRQFRAVEGLAGVYQRWSINSGAQFHYVSGSPWQLFPTLQDFIGTNQFPSGSWHLRTVRLLSLSVMELRRPPDTHKKQAIEELLA
ncbi:MAG: phosphatase domain-containing protein, partial [Verrucomicrobiota bacterium]